MAGENMQSKTERFEMRLDPGTVERVDEWRTQQADLPSRAEAVRRLMDAGLSTTQNKAIRFSDGEKLATLMLCEIYKHLKIDGDIDPAFVEEALFGGHYWGLAWKYTGIFHDYEEYESVVTEVVEILAMWSSMESSYAKLSKDNRSKIESEAGPLGKHVSFSGFDGNNEGQYLSATRFLIESLERFAEFKDRDLNSHVPSIGRYRRMLTVFKPMKRTLAGGNLAPGEIVQLLNA
jgi:hypothetical protein